MSGWFLRGDFYAGHALHDILCRNSGFWFTYVLLSAGGQYFVIKQYHQDAPKEKLPIKIADVDRIHVYDMYVLES